MTYDIINSKYSLYKDVAIIIAYFHHCRMVTYEQCPISAKSDHVQDECNWILSGRDPHPDNIEEEDENTLDDISGDEVSSSLQAPVSQPLAFLRP